MERTYRINVAAEMSGVSEGLIRAWERRYGVLKPKRTPSGYRAYTESDITVLKRLKQLTEEGVSIAEAVKLLPSIKRDVKEQLDKAERATPRAPKAGQTDKWRHEILVAAERLDQLTLDFPMIATEEAKGPMVAALHAERSLPLAFIDDMVHNLHSVGAHVPECLLIEPTETEDRDTLDAFVEALCAIREEARTDIATLKAAPYRMPVRRLDDVRAARQLDIRYVAPTAGSAR